MDTITGAGSIDWPLERLGLVPSIYRQLASIGLVFTAKSIARYIRPRRIQPLLALLDLVLIQYPSALLAACLCLSGNK